MGSALAELASDLGYSERSLRRYVNEGVLKGRRLGPHDLALLPGEEEYVRSHWPTLAALRAALRTERSVELAVLFGSVATGEDTADSDVDLYVQFRDRDAATASLALQARLTSRLGRPVHIVTVAPKDAANLVESVIREGRVLIDRGDAWAELRGREHAIRKAANTEAASMMARAREVLSGAAG